MLRKALLLIFSLITICCTAKTYGVNDIPYVNVVDHTKHLSNPDNIISKNVAAQIDSLLLDARNKTSAEIAVVIVDDIDRDDIDSFATELFNTWGIGKKDKNNGILMIVDKNSRAATIRTGYGSEGIMPDIIAGRIINDIMKPYFKDGDYDQGLLDGVMSIHAVVTDPDNAPELLSKLKDKHSGIDGDALFNSYVGISMFVGIAAIMVLLLMLHYVNSKKMSDYQKYEYLKKYQLVFWIATFLFLGMPLIAAGAMKLISNYWRNHPRKCPHCHAQMKKLDEAADNQYLTYAQDLEERIKSVDYDVWLCPKCGEKDIYSFVNQSSNYKKCNKCQAHTVKLTGARIISEPTYSREGVGEKQYVCLNCQNHTTQRYKIAKKEKPVVIVGPGGGGRGFGGGGTIGGGFGGGLTGGGGATGRW